jgi:hypothetical protein
VAVGEVLPDADALAVGEVFLVGVGFADFVGCGLTGGPDDGTGRTTRLEVGVGCTG